MAGLCDDFNRVSVFQLVSQRNDVPVHLGADALMADFRMDAVGEVDRSRTLRKGSHVAVRCKHIDLFGEQGHLQVGHEFSWIFDLLLCIQQISKELDLIIIGREGAALLVSPVRRNPLLRPFMHRTSPDLNLHAFPIGPDHRCME